MNNVKHTASLVVPGSVRQSSSCIRHRWLSRGGRRSRMPGGRRGCGVQWQRQAEQQALAMAQACGSAAAECGSVAPSMSSGPQLGWTRILKTRKIRAKNTCRPRAPPNGAPPAAPRPIPECAYTYHTFSAPARPTTNPTPTKAILRYLRSIPAFYGSARGISRCLTLKSNPVPFQCST